MQTSSHMVKRVYTVGSLIPGKELTQSTEWVIVKAVQKEAIVAKPSKIVLQQHGKSFEILPVKGKLLDVALNQGKPLQYKCRKGTCGQCTVKVINGVGLSLPNDLEKKKLGDQVVGGLRLACQAEILI
jgi:ferredoxin, 2Fe-2S